MDFLKTRGVSVTQKEDMATVFIWPRGPGGL